MLTLAQVKKLAAIESKQEDIVTLVLMTDQQEQSNEQIKIKLKDLLATLRERNLNQDAKKIEAYFNDINFDGVKAVYVVSSTTNNIFETLIFNVHLLSQVKIARKVFVSPLLRLLDEYERFAVVLIDKERMKLYSIYLGEITEEEKYSQDFPGHHAQGGWSQTKFQRHVEEHARIIMKKAAAEMFKFFQNNSFDRLILGGSKEILGDFKKLLHPELKKRLSGDFTREIFLSDAAILEKSLLIEKEIELKKDQELVARLLESLGQGNKAVRGLDRVLEKFEKGEVMEFIIDSDYIEPGYKCRACGHLSLTDLKCTMCGGELEYFDDLVSELASEAVNKNVKVGYVHEKAAAGLKKNKNIGAFLRY